MYNDTVGVIGGFGAFASLDFYRRILNKFYAENERDYPHIIMDNNFSMPSRTRALLYGEHYEEVVEGIAASMRFLIEAGKVKWIILVCGTAHFFLDDVYKLVPEAKERVLDIINLCGEVLEEFGEKKALVIAAEGALLKRLYPMRLERYGIECLNPDEGNYERIRYFIERVKRNNLSQDVVPQFIDFLTKFEQKNVILGCTEFPVLVDFINKCDMKKEYRDIWESFVFYDPLEIVIEKLRLVMK